MTKAALCEFFFVFAVLLGETLDEQQFHSALFVALPPPVTQPPLATWTGLSPDPLQGPLPPMVQWLGLLFRRALGPCLRLALGDQHSRLMVPAPPALGVRGNPSGCC